MEFSTQTGDYNECQSGQSCIFVIVFQEKSKEKLMRSELELQLQEKEKQLQEILNRHQEVRPNLYTMVNLMKGEGERKKLGRQCSFEREL